LVFVAGTGTEVGKTWVSAQLLGRARAAGHTVAARKPLQSFSPGDTRTDSVVLGEATGEPPSAVCPERYSYPAPMAPPMAGAALSQKVPAQAELVAGISASWPDRCDIGLVEGAGGVASPLTADADGVAVARALGPDVVVLVTDAALGVINLVRLSLAALAPLPVIVHLNRFHPVDDLHRRNRDWLVDHDRFEVTTSIPDLLAKIISARP
jgi:dethiobiotin synthetase